MYIVKNCTPVDVFWDGDIVLFTCIIISIALISLIDSSNSDSDDEGHYEVLGRSLEVFAM